MRKFASAISFAFATLFLTAAASGAQTRLLRFPDLHGDQVVFSYAGDLWIASASGGAARRLTAHPGVELFAKFSPDGSRIAFTGQYDGDEQVYVMPAAGGEPQQLTYYPAQGPLPARWGYDNQIFDWTPDGSAVLFRSLRYGTSIADGRLFTVSAEGGLPEPLPMPRAGAGDYAPDGQQVVYSPLFRDFRTWKRYEGGWAQDLFIFDLETWELQQVTDHPRSDRDPMWIGNRIYFSSDRTGTLNLFSFDPRTEVVEQLTEHDLWDLRWPSDDGEGRIVYELNGELQIYEISTGTSKPIAISVPDDGLARRPSRVSAAGLVEDFALSPKGERALFVARGDLFSAPIEKGPTRNLTRSSDAHDKAARWSPDGRRIAFSDKDGKLYVLEVESGELTEIADEARGQLRDYVWSPRGGHLAFSLSEPNEFDSIWIWSAADGESRRVTSPYFHEFLPAWDPEGNYLYFLADREYAPQISSIEWNYATDRETYIYALALRSDVPHPFPPESDEVEIDGEDEEGEEEGEEEEREEAKEPIRIDFEGLGERVARVPVEADNYHALAAVEGHLLYLRAAPFYYGRAADLEPELRIFSFEKREETTLAEEVDDFALSADGSKVLVQHGSTYKLYDASPSGAESAKEVSTAGLMVDRVPAHEWSQIFDEVWRRYRDFFYVENMHGYDWQALRERYRPWLEHVAHRSDLNYVIGEMIAELNVGHAYKSGGDFAIPERPAVALPGAELELDGESGRYRIARILPGHNEEEIYRSPLTEIGIEAAEGEYLLAIDGEQLTAGVNPYRLLRHKADRPVTLTVSASPEPEGAREVSFRPISDEQNLRYLDRVSANLRRVDEMSGGRIGYLHLPDMGSAGIREFIKWYYPQIRKEGLVVDVRGNGGGNVSQMLIERLDRELLGTRFSRTIDTPRTYPNEVFYGHMACLLNEDSGSDGDIFPHRFREAGLGPLIGKRSWGGVVGITSHGPLIDGGDVRVPQFGTNGVDGSWIIEGHGVDPDIVVENDAKSLLEGKDPQLERAVAELLRRIEEDPRRLPERPADPIKTE